MAAFRDTSGVEYAAQGAIVLKRREGPPDDDGRVTVDAHVVKLRNGPWPRAVSLLFDGARNFFQGQQ